MIKAANQGPITSHWNWFLIIFCRFSPLLLLRPQTFDIIVKPGWRVQATLCKSPQNCFSATSPSLSIFCIKYPLIQPLIKKKKKSTQKTKLLTKKLFKFAHQRQERCPQQQCSCQMWVTLTLFRELPTATRNRTREQDGVGWGGGLSRVFAWRGWWPRFCKSTHILVGHSLTGLLMFIKVRMRKYHTKEKENMEWKSNWPIFPPFLHPV